MKRYKDSLEWLKEKIKGSNSIGLIELICKMLPHLKLELIEKIFKNEMIEDGYYEDWHVEYYEDYNGELCEIWYRNNKYR